MVRITLTKNRDKNPGEVTFECTREDFHNWLFINDISHVSVETDGNLLFVIYSRIEVDKAIKQMLDPSKPLIADYRKFIVARETWRSLLQLLSDYKHNKQ